MTRQVIASLTSLVTIGVLTPHVAAAQQPPAQRPPASQPSAPQQSDQPPIIRFDPGGIALEEAVNLTLQNTPLLKLQDAEVQRAAGAEQEARGQFDLSFLSRLNYTYRVQELSENRKQDEVRKRDTIRQELDNNRASRNNAQALVDQLKRVQAAPPGSAEVQALTQLSPTLGAQVQVIDALIAASSGAQRTSLLNVRNTLLSDTLQTSQDNLTQLITDFNDAQTALTNLGEPPVDEVFYNGAVRVELSKQYRNGLTFTPFFDGSIDGTNFKGKPKSQDFGGKGIDDLFTFHAGAEFLVPLKRGRGSDAVAARERAAGLEVESSRFTGNHKRSVSALGTISAYWGLRGAQEALEIANRSAALNTRIVGLTQNLIRAGDLPAVELARAQAGESRARARVEEVQRSVHEARVQLATAMGVATNGDESTLPTARDAFPAVDAPAGGQPVAGWVTAAPDARRDVAAAAKAQESSEVIREGAATNLRSRLDLSTNLFFTALDEKSLGNAIDRWVGPSTSSSLEFEKPIGNNRFRGQMAQADASAREQAIAATDLRRQVRLGVVRAASTLPDALSRLRNAQDTVQFSQAIIDAEVQRFQQNEATLLDTIITEQQAADAAFALVTARQDLALLIAQLRFETGTLIGDGPVQRPNLVTPPPAASGR